MKPFVAALVPTLPAAMSALAPGKLCIATTSDYSPFYYFDNAGAIMDETKMAALDRDLGAPADGERI